MPQRLVEVARRHGEAAFAAPQLAPLADHLGRGIPGLVHDDGAFERGVVVGIEPDEADRGAVFAGVPLGGQIGPARRRFGTRHIGKVLEPAVVLRVG